MTIEDSCPGEVVFPTQPRLDEVNVGGCESPTEGNLLVVMEVLESDGKLFRRTVTILYFQV